MPFIRITKNCSMRILNLYAGIGGNRKLWDNSHEITSVEYDESIASAYKHNFPGDTIVIGDAHKYLLENYSNFDFIWASPPCPTHSKARFARHKSTDPAYPDMKLYQEIIYLKHHFKGKWIVENVNPYYDVLIPETKKIGRHLFWSNLPLGNLPDLDADIEGMTVEEFNRVIGIDIKGFKFNQRKDKIMRNCVSPKVGESILNFAQGIILKENINQQSIFDFIQ